MMDWFFDPNIWASLLTLTAMEIILGIDNILFISLVVANLEGKKKKVARQLGLSMAFIFRVLMLMGIAWIITMKTPLFTVFGQPVSWRDIILITGGLFLIYKATHEIHKEIEGGGEQSAVYTARSSFFLVIAQIAVIDLIFSIDSIITAVGMAEHVPVMVAAVVIAMIVMYLASGAIGKFIEAHPTTKMLALSFLFMIGAALIADGVGFHIPRGYIYSAMAFSAAVEFINVLASRRRRARAKARANKSA